MNFLTFKSDLKLEQNLKLPYSMASTIKSKWGWKTKIYENNSGIIYDVGFCILISFCKLPE